MRRFSFLFILFVLACTPSKIKFPEQTGPDQNQDPGAGSSDDDTASPDADPSGNTGGTGSTDSTGSADPTGSTGSTNSTGSTDSADINTTALDGPAAHLLIDGSVHTGTDWNGQPYIGVWGETFNFNMTDYPVTWAMALVHASLILESRGIHYNPNAILSVAIKESRLGCQNASFPNQDGCFQIEDGTAYTELKRIFPTRFTAPHSTIIAGGHFETSALSMVHYILFSMEMFYLHSSDPQAFFANHPEPAKAEHKVISAAYNRGLWWTGLDKVFANCTTKEVTECFEGHAIAIDHADAIEDYAEGLDKTAPFDAALTLNDLKNYWTIISPLYPDANATKILATLATSFANASGGLTTVSFNKDLGGILTDLINALPQAPTLEATRNSLCDIGYLYSATACP